MSRSKSVVVAPPSGGTLARQQDVRDFLQQKADEQRERAVPRNTRRAYETDWQQFEGWCRQVGHQPLPASEEALCQFLTHLSLDRRIRRRKKGPRAGELIEGFSFQPTSIARKLTSVVRHHKDQGYPSPRTHKVTSQLRAVIIERESVPGGSPPVLGAHLKAMADAMSETIELAARDAPVAIRDRAVLLVGWHCAMRRSEIANLKVASIEFQSEGMTVHIGRSKTDQLGKGRTLWLKASKQHPAACPIAAVKAWLDVRGTEAGPLFWHARRSRLERGEQMAPWQLITILDRWSARAEISAASKEKTFTPHGLRAGFITQAMKRNRPIKDTMDHSGHRSLPVFMGYVRNATGFDTTVQDGILDE